MQRFLAPFVFALAPLAAGQTALDQLGVKSHLPTSYSPADSADFGDVDGDGDLDLLTLASNAAGHRLFLNDGAGRYSEAAGPTAIQNLGISARDAILGDLTGDGFDDVLLIGPSSLSTPDNVRLLLSDGSGGFTDATATNLPGTILQATEAVFADVDGDGDLDVALASAFLFGGSTLIYINDGSGSFSDETAARLSQASDTRHCIAAADMNSDGAIDLLVGYGSTSDHGFEVLVNDGVGNFGVLSVPTVDLVYNIEAGDVDGDGVVDVVTGGPTTKLLLSDGLGTFILQSQDFSTQGFTSDIVLLDLGSDGDLDLLVVPLFGNFELGSPSLFENDGFGNLADISASSLPTLHGAYSRIASGDVDGDGYPDIVLAAGGPSLGSGPKDQTRLLFGTAAGLYLDGCSSRLWPRKEYAYLKGSILVSADAGVKDMLFGDLDADGDLDAIVIARDEVHIQLNQGASGFALSDALTLTSSTSHPFTAGALLDTDGDGDLDLLVGELGKVRQWRNDTTPGSIKFVQATSTRMPGSWIECSSLALGDVNGDGIPDLLVGSSAKVNAEDHLYLGSAGGVFSDVSAANLPAADAATSAVALFDVDSDGDLDAFAVGPGPSALYINDGAGLFTASAPGSLPGLLEETHSLSVGDVNGDGILDVVLGNGKGTGAGQRNRIYLGDGAGNLADASAALLPATLQHAGAIALEDLDLDGDLDLAVATVDALETSTYYLNDGGGVFSLAPAGMFPTNLGLTESLVFTDFDEDGDRDLFHGGVLNINLRRQLNAPYFARLGEDYTLVHYSKPGYGTSSHTAITAFAPFTSPMPIALAFGALFLDPASLAYLPTTSIPAVAGKGFLTFPIPADPALAGFEFHVQSLIINDTNPGDIHLSNLVSERIQ